MNQTLEYLQELLAVPSPTGYTVGVQEYLMKTLEKLGYPYKRTPKGTIIITVEGKDNTNSRVVTAHVEMVALLSKLDVDKHISVEIELDEMDLISSESKATYAQIKEYVWNKFQLKVPTLYIAQIKRKCGIELREHYNKSKKEKDLMDQKNLTAKLLDLVEGLETPESWRNWWDEHEPELEALLSRSEFLKLKPCRHGFQWVPVFGSQKGAIAILEKSGIAFEASNLYQERYLVELDAFCKEQERVQREKQKEFKASHPELFGQYPNFFKALAKVLDPTDKIQPAATEEQIRAQESVLDFTLPSQVREFFLLTADINVSTGVILTLSGMFDLTIHGERYCVLGEFWKEADGDQLLLRPGEDTIWYYAHEQDKVKRLCNDMTELLEKKLARYLNEH